VNYANATTCGGYGGNGAKLMILIPGASGFTTPVLYPALWIKRSAVVPEWKLPREAVRLRDRRKRE